MVVSGNCNYCANVYLTLCSKYVMNRVIVNYAYKSVFPKDQLTLKGPRGKAFSTMCYQWVL